MLSAFIPELELFSSDGERRTHLVAAVRQAIRPSTFWSPGVIMLFVAACVAMVLATMTPMPPLLSLVLLYGVPFAFPYVLTRAGIGRIRRVLRERLNVAGRPCCLKCGYDASGLRAPMRCPECNADCSNLPQHAGTPIAESAVFPELLEFSRPGEAKDALQRAYVEAGPFYEYRFKMLLPLALCTAMVILVIGPSFVRKRGEPVVPEEAFWWVGLVIFVGAALVWHRMLCGAVRDSLERQLQKRERSPTPCEEPRASTGRLCNSASITRRGS